MGTLLTYFVLPPFPPHLAYLLEEYDLIIPPLPNITLPALEFEWRHLTDSFMTPTRRWLENRDFKAGDQARDNGLQAEHPIIIIPGIISTVGRLVRVTNASQSLSYSLHSDRD